MTMGNVQMVQLLHTYFTACNKSQMIQRYSDTRRGQCLLLVKCYDHNLFIAARMNLILHNLVQPEPVMSLFCLPITLNCDTQEVTSFLKNGEEIFHAFHILALTEFVKTKHLVVIVIQIIFVFYLSFK